MLKKLLPILMLTVHFVKKIVFVHCKRKLFDYEKSVEHRQEPETKFKVEFFQLHFGCSTTISGGEVLADAATQHTLQISIKLSSLRNMSKEHLMKHCVDLQALLTDKQTGEADIDGLQIMEDVNVLSVLVKTNAPPL
jgi:hypothetical protein